MNADRKHFTPYFSDRSRDLGRIAMLEAQIQAERDIQSQFNQDIERLTREKRQLLDSLLKVNFEARVAKGCYTSCPVGRIHESKKSTRDVKGSDKNLCNASSSRAKFRNCNAYLPA